MSAKTGQDEHHPISYPSPTDATMDAAPFYDTEVRDDATEQTVQQNSEHHGQPAQDEQNIDPAMHADPEQHGYQDQPPPSDSHIPHQAVKSDPSNNPQEQAPPQHEQITRPTNLEELQLAAQLGQGLAGGTLMSHSDATMHVEDSNLQSILPHPDGEHHPEHYTHTPTSDSMVQHTLAVPIGPPLPSQYAVNDGVPPRKRSKVSRACDECRRKKIKCDAQSDTGESACSSCARSSTACLFSRVPQKRGPSKGYIKELADRIHSIEHKLEAEGGGSLSQDDLDKLFGSSRSQHLDDTSRKRPFSSISGDFSSTARQTPWGSMEPRYLQPAAPGDGQHYPNDSLAPQPAPLKIDNSLMNSQAPDPDVTVPDADDVLDVDEEALHDYLSNIQTIYPIIANSKARTESLLSQCPGPLRAAFCIALLVATQAPGGDAKLANSLLHVHESTETSEPTPSVNIVHAQTLLLLLIDADAHALPSFPLLLARTMILADKLNLWKFHPVNTVSELDSDDQLYVRIWWSLVLLDRWHAAGTGKHPKIQDKSVVIPSGLESIVGQVSYYLLRLSNPLNHVSFIASGLQEGHTQTDARMAYVLSCSLEDIRSDILSHVDISSLPPVHTAYWHTNILITILNPESTPSMLVGPVKELATILASDYSETRPPLLSHHISLLIFALSQLSKTGSRKDDIASIARAIYNKPGHVCDALRNRAISAPPNEEGPTTGDNNPDSANATTNGNIVQDDNLTLAEGYLNSRAVVKVDERLLNTLMNGGDEMSVGEA